MKLSSLARRFVIVPAALILAWAGLTYSNAVNPILLPPPHIVAVAFGRATLSANVWADVGKTLLRIATGLTLACAIGIPLGLMMGSSHRVRELMSFPVDFFRSIPGSALFPLFILVLGLGSRSAIALVVYPCTWLLTINAMYGVQNSSPARRRLAKAYRATRLQQFLKVTLPDALPYLASGLRLCLAIAMIVAVVAEMFTGSRDGLGRRIFDSHFLMRIPEMYALILLTGILGYALNRAYVAAETRIVHWSGRC
jgi:NitT/TauT family transport system permease protein